MDRSRSSISACSGDGRIEVVEDFAEFDHNGDGRVDDDDLLFAVTLRSGHPDQDLVLDDCRQRLRRPVRAGRLARRPELTLNLGLR